jgi:uncharacterized damage-inducible protein DinB
MTANLDSCACPGGVIFSVLPFLMRYQFLVETYETELLKVASVWSMFHDDDLSFRPHPTDPRGRSVREHMVHQCVSEDNWFKNMFGIDVGAPPLPKSETRMEFIRRYAEDACRRLDALRLKDDAWWEAEASFFKVQRPRTWIMVRRVAHTSHHRGQQIALLRMLNREIYSNYGPTADTGGLAQSQAQVIYAYADLKALLSGESKALLPPRPTASISERP